MLDPDRERAGEKYESIRHRLVKFFEWRGSPTPVDHADETIDRVCNRLAEGEQIHASDPGSYFHGVARNVLRESWKRARRVVEAPIEARAEPTLDPARQESAETKALEHERGLACLVHCLETLSPESRQLLRAYYEEQKAAKIARRKDLADHLGIPLGALRSRVHRLRERLQPCVTECLGKSATHGRSRP